MLSHPGRGPGRGSFITSRSVHNTRIERLWRDVFQSCIVQYYNLFKDMEEAQLFDIDDKRHIFCLQLIFLPKISEWHQNTICLHNNSG